MSDTKNILIVGVGGQGTVLTSKLLGEAAMLAGFDVKQSEVHGMAQRGGSVVTQVRFGKKIYVPTIEKGTADVILAMEKVEALRWCNFLKVQDGVIVVNDLKIKPVQDLLKPQKYPDDEEIKNELAVRGNIIYVDALSIAKGIGDVRVFNTVLLGAAACRLGISQLIWQQSINNVLNGKVNMIDKNKSAFILGWELGEKS